MERLEVFEMDLRQYVVKSHAESILQKGMILGNYSLGGLKVELPSIVLQGNGVLSVTAQVYDKTGAVILIKFFVLRVDDRSRVTYQFRVRSALSSHDFTLTPQGGQVGTAEPTTLIVWPNGDLNITELSITILELMKKITTSVSARTRRGNV